MLKLIMGSQGHGKTKALVEAVNTVAEQSKGNVLCLAKGKKLRDDLTHKIRLINTGCYNIGSYQVLRGFITGLYAGNFDITDIFIDSLSKVADEYESAECSKFLLWADAFGKENDVNFFITISQEIETATDTMKSFLVEA